MFIKPSILGGAMTIDATTVTIFLQILHESLNLRVYSNQSHGAILNNFFFACYEWAQKARVFVPVRLFQPSLMFASKARSLPYFFGVNLVKKLIICADFGLNYTNSL
jgi:hypothetical protein